MSQRSTVMVTVPGARAFLPVPDPTPWVVLPSPVTVDTTPAAGDAIGVLADGGGVPPVTRHGPSAPQAVHDVICAALRRVLSEGAQAGPGAEEGISSLLCRVSGALYALLMAHPVDRHGLCWSCRRPGSVLGRRQLGCLVHFEAGYWLHQPEKLLHARAAHKWGLTQPVSGVATAPGQESSPGPTMPETGWRAYG